MSEPADDPAVEPVDDLAADPVDDLAVEPVGVAEHSVVGRLARGVRWRMRRLTRRMRRGVRALAPAAGDPRRRIAHRRMPVPPPPRGIAARNERENLDLVIGAAERAGIDCFLVPTSHRQQIRIGIPRDRLADLLGELASDPEATVSMPALGRWATVDPGSVLELLAPDAASIHVHRMPSAVYAGEILDVARSIEVNLWVEDPPGMLTSGRVNSYASEVPATPPTATREVRTGRQVPTYPVFAVPDTGEVRFPVDAVYLWVSDSDPAYLERKQRALEGLGVSVQQSGPEATADFRFREHDELRYSLRSLSACAPWIRRVFLVTDRQRPAWLADDPDVISVIDHTELFGDDGRLPTFNSHALSARLHHIPDLADHFLYLNDDVFLGRRVTPEQWFAGNGMPLFHNTRSRNPAGGADQPAHIGARNLSIDLCARDFGVTRRRNLQHGPHPLRRSTLFMLEERYPEEFARTWRSQLRNPDDLEVVWLHNLVGYAMGLAFPGRDVRYDYLDVGGESTPERLDRLLNDRGLDTFCLNDTGGGEVTAQERHERIVGFLGAYFPEPSEFEA